MSKKTGLIKYGKLFGGYSVGVFLNQSINLLLIPVFWKVLTPEDFGIIAITQIIALFLQPIYIFGASETIQRFYYKWPEEARPHYLSWFFWFIFGFTLLLTLLLEVLGSYFSHYIIVNVAYDPLLRFALWSNFFANFINFPIAVSRIRQKVLTYNILVNGSFLTQIGIVYYLVKIQQLGAYGYIKGFFIANFIWFFPIVFMTLKENVVFPKKQYFKIPLRYATPITFAGIIEGLSIVMDRYFLDKFLPLATIGFYNLARQFGSLISIINTVFKLIFVPYIYKVNALKNNAAYILGHLGLIYGVAMTIPLLAVCTLAPEVVRLLDPSGVYHQIITYIPYFALSYYFVSLAIVIGRGMDLVGTTKWSFVVPTAGLAASLVVYLICLPSMGIWGVLWGFIAGHFTRSLVNILFAIYYFPRRLYLAQLVSSWFLTLMFYLFLHFLKLDNDFASLGVKLFVIGILCFVYIRFIVANNLWVFLPIKAEKKDAL